MTTTNMNYKEAIWRMMSTGDWYTLSEIAEFTGAPEASISARLRDFRKPQYGNFSVDKQYHERDRCWQYRLRVI
jgi:hypothetical protein